MRIAERIRRLHPSLTLAVAAKAEALRRRGIDVVAFGVGEPDFDTPENVKEAAIRALGGRGVGKYTAVAGTPALRAAVAEELNRVHGTRFAAEQVIVSVGAKHSLYNLFMASLDAGDEVILPSPAWVSYTEMITMAGGRPVLLQTPPGNFYRLDEEALARAISPRTRALLLNSPCNPTGAVYDEKTLVAVARLMARHPDLYVITDDIYRRLVYGVPYVSLAKLAPELSARVIIVDGVSKSYAMTGWRIGFCAGPKELIEAMTTLQGQSTTNPSAVAQVAALEALTGPQDSVENMRAEFDRRRRLMVEQLRTIPGVRLVEPRGAFYCFPDFSARIGGEVADDVALAEWLLEHARVAVIPGSGFFAPGHLRFSYATSMEQVEEGMSRVKNALSQLK
jgi:aspartate aminotransferase